MDPREYALWGVLAPAVWAGVLLLLGWLSSRAEPERRRWLAAVAIGGGFLLGYGLTLNGVPRFPPAGSQASIFYLAFAAILVGALENASTAARWVLRAALSFGAPWLILRHMVSQWEETRVVVELLVLGACFLLLWGLLDAWARRRPGVSVPLVLWMCATATAWALYMASTAKLAQLGGTLAATLGAAVVVAWLRPSLVLTGGAGAFAVVLGSLCIIGSSMATVPKEVAVLLAAAPLAGWLGEARPIARMAPAKAAGARLLLVALPLGAALWLAYRSMPAAYQG